MTGADKLLAADGARAAAAAAAFTPLTVADVAAALPDQPPWLVPTVLARGSTTLLAGMPKIGKGTFLAWLLAQISAGKDTFFGRSTATRPLVYTEEPVDSFAEKYAGLGVASEVDVLFQYEAGGALAHIADVGVRRQELANRLVEACERRGAGLLYVDNIVLALWVGEESGVEAALALKPLHEACKRAGLALLVDHHTRKVATMPQPVDVRGGTALTGLVDSYIMYGRLSGAAPTVRGVSSLGRRRAHVWQHTVEFDPATGHFAQVAEGLSSGGTPRDVERMETVAARESGLSVSDMADAFGVSRQAASKWAQKQVEAQRLLPVDIGGQTLYCAVHGDAPDV